MDDPADRARHPAQGGTVEPQNPTDLPKPRLEAPPQAHGSRFEIYDPTTDLTYRLRSLKEAVVKADELGSLRITAIDEHGGRTRLHRTVDGWESPPPTTQEQTSPDLAKREPPQIRIVAVSGTQRSAVHRPDPPVTVDVDAGAERAARVAQLEKDLGERYVVKRAMVTIGDRPVGQSEYRFRGDTSRVAFTETTFRLSTDTNSPSVARSMIDVAEARDWKAIRVSGHEDFRRMVWLEASVRGVNAIGYEPVAGDLEVLHKSREARQVNRIEPTADTSAPASKGSVRGGGSRKAVLAAIDAVLVAQRVPEKRREAIMAAAAENLSKRLAAGEVHKVKVYDKAVAPQRSVTPPIPEQQRTLQRSERVR